MTLELRLASATWGKRSVQVYANSKKALDHICDHVLTRPETLLWAMYIPVYNKLLDPNNKKLADQKGRQELARKIWFDHAADQAQELYDGYADEIKRSLAESENRKWFWGERDALGMRYTGLSLSGLRVGWTAINISTAFFPFPFPSLNAGPDHDQELTVAQRRQRPLPREPEGANNPRWMVQAITPEMVRFAVFYRCAEGVRRKYSAALTDRGITVTSTPDWDSFVKSLPGFSGWMQEWRTSGRHTHGETVA